MMLGCKKHIFKAALPRSVGPKVGAEFYRIERSIGVPILAFKFFHIVSPVYIFTRPILSIVAQRPRFIRRKLTTGCPVHHKSEF